MRRTAFKLFLLIFISISVLYANDETKYDMKYLFKKINYQIKEDGTIVKDYHHKLKLYTDKAFNRLAGETFIKYNPKYQKLEIIKSQTTMKSGVKVDSPKNAYNEVLPREAEGFDIYSNLKEMVLSHTALEEGATIELHYKLTTKPGFFPYFSVLDQVNDNYPIDEYVLTVNSYKPLKTELINGVNGAEFNRQNNYFSFKASNIKAISIEPQSLGSKSMLLLGLKDEKIELPVLGKGDFPVNVKDKLKKLREKSPDNLAYVRELSKYFDTILSTCKVPLSLSSYNLRTPQAIINSAYALKIEKVLLLQKALKLFEIETFVAGELKFHLSTPLSVGSVNLYDPCILLLKGDKFFSVKKKRLLGKSEKSNIFIWGKNLLAKNEKSLPSDNSLKVKTFIYGTDKESKAYFSANGIFTNYIGEPNKVKSVLKNKLGQIFPYFKFSKIKITDIVNGVITGEAKVNFKSDDSNYIEITTLSIPFFRNLLALEKRANDLKFYAPFKIDNTLVFDGISKRIGYYLKNKIKKNNKFGKVSVEVLKGDKKITLKESVELKEDCVSNKDYPLFKNLITDFCDKETLFYIKNKKKDKKVKSLKK